MVRVERRKGVLFSVILLGTAFSGYMYYYIRDNWNLEAREARVGELEQAIKEKQAKVKELQQGLDEKK